MTNFVALAIKRNTPKLVHMPEGHIKFPPKYLALLLLLFYPLQFNSIFVSSWNETEFQFGDTPGLTSQNEGIQK